MSDNTAKVLVVFMILASMTACSISHNYIVSTKNCELAK